MSPKLNIDRGPSSLSIEYDWRSAGAWFMVIFSIFWNGFIIVALIAGAGLFISIHLIVGVLIAYYTLTRFLNKTTIEVSRLKLSIAHGPLPWFGKNQEIESSSLEQVFVKRSLVQKKVNNKQIPLYNLIARLDTGAEVTLLKSLEDREMIDSLEASIENYLSIEDEDIPLVDASNTVDLSGFKEMLPERWAKKIEEAEAKYAEDPLPASKKARSRKDGSVTIGHGHLRPRPLTDDDHPGFAFYATPEGATVHHNDTPYRLGRSAQLDWESAPEDTSRQLELRSASGGGPLYFYADFATGRWNYFEERRLDDGEVSSLGFSSAGHPNSFANGDDKYYPRDRQAGVRFSGAVPEPVTQYVYFTTRSSTLFRALQTERGHWEVYVQEPADRSLFS